MQLTDFAERLTELIYERNIDIKTFSQSLDVSASCISQYIHRESLPTVDNLIKIANFFNCSTDYLLGREEENLQLKFNLCPPFSEQLKFLKDYFNCTAYSIYVAAGISKSRYFDWQNGKRQPSLDNVLKLAEHFDRRVDFILGRET